MIVYQYKSAGSYLTSTRTTAVQSVPKFPLKISVKSILNSSIEFYKTFKTLF